MQRDPVRDALQQRLWQQGVSLAEASLAIGRNKAYLQQFLARGMPRVLSHQDTETLAKLLGCDPRRAAPPRAAGAQALEAHEAPRGRRRRHGHRRRDGGRGRRRSRAPGTRSS